MHVSTYFRKFNNLVAFCFFFFQAEDGIRDRLVTGVQTCALPIFSGVTLGSLVTGSLVVETVFAWPGLGQLAIKSLVSNDYPLLQAVIIIFTLMYVTAALLVDVMYAYVDPRIRYA